MTDPKITDSLLSRTVTEDGEDLQIYIYRLETEDQWTLEVVDSAGTSTVWDDSFGSDADALAAALKAIEEDGVHAFKNKTVH